MAQKPTSFTLRVYGILENQRGEVLLSSEKIKDFAFTKFPGGGLELGEGLEDCLRREFMEETELNVRVGELLFATPNFVQSRFDARLQVICLYYRVHLREKNAAMPEGFEERDHPFEKTQNRIQLFWQRPEKVAERLTFDTDKMAWEEIKD